MKKLSWALGVVVLAFAGDRLGGFLLAKITRESQFRYSRLYQGKAVCDILLAGNSRGLIFYQPYIEQATGMTTCNLSYNGMPVELASPLLMDYLDRHPAPELLVWDITLMDSLRMDHKLVSAFNLYAPYSNRLRELLEAGFANDYYAGKLSHLYRHNSEVFQRAFFYLKKSDKDWLLDREISPTMQREVSKHAPFRFHITPLMLDKLAQTVKYAQQKGVRVELVINPYYPPFLEKIENLPELKRRIGEATGLTVRDYSNSISDTKGFGDYQHLNKFGAKLFIEKMVSDGVWKRMDME
jgi:hypothetical protein